MRRCHHPEPYEVTVRFKPEADAMTQAEVDLLLAVWPNLLRALEQAEATATESAAELE